MLREGKIRDGWIDVSLPLRPGMPAWPGDTPFTTVPVRRMLRGDEDNLSGITMSAHTGTHVDAPLHFLRTGRSIDRMPLATAVGPARVIRIRDRSAVTPGELKSHRLRRGERILFRTRNSGSLYRRGSFSRDFVSLTPEAASFLVGAGVILVGIDYLSVGAFAGGGETHRVLLGGGIWVVEGLDLAGVAPGRYLLACLPLRLEGLEAAPARVLLRPAAGGIR